MRWASLSQRVHLLVDLKCTSENDDINVSGKRHILAHTQCLGTTVAFIWQPTVFNVHLLVDCKFTYIWKWWSQCLKKVTVTGVHTHTHTHTHTRADARWDRQTNNQTEEGREWNCTYPCFQQNDLHAEWHQLPGCSKSCDTCPDDDHSTVTLHCTVNTPHHIILIYILIFHYWRHCNWAFCQPITCFLPQAPFDELQKLFQGLYRC